MKFSPKLFCAAIAVLFLAATVGCASIQNSGAKVLVSTVQTVDAAMQGWAAYVVLNQVPEEKQSVVRRYYSSYQMAVAAAEQAYFTSIATGDKDVWLKSADALRSAQSALMMLISQFQAGPNANGPGPSSRVRQIPPRSIRVLLAPEAIVPVPNSFN